MPPKKKKTIQDIKPSRKAKTVRARVAKTKKEAIEVLSKEGVIKKETPAKKTVKKKRSKSSGFKPFTGQKFTPLWGVVVAVVAFFVFSLSLLFSGATVYVTPQNISLPEGDLLLSGQKDSTTGLSFQVISVEGDREMLAEPDITEQTSRPATGIVTLYNNHSTSPQRLLIDTRLRGSNGEVYKTKTATQIPGQTVVNGEKVPGQVDIEVYADVPGESGNLEMSDFVIMGFQGTSKATTFYGRSKTPISGGFDGELHSLSEESALIKEGEVRRLLRDDLEAKLKAQIPSGFMLVLDSQDYKTLEKNERYESDGGQIRVFERGRLAAVILDQDVLARAVAQEAITIYESGEDVILSNPLSVIAKLSGSSVGIELQKDLKFSISGKPHIVWVIDEDKLLYDLIDTKKKRFSEILERHEYIDSARVKISPFWKGSLPEDPEDIEIEYEIN
jgi:hypothetical protein